jgi:hypothetical protein
MEQYLLELIKNNNRVIVPNFGAFIVSRDAGTTVLFNNFLSFNDGLLVNYISSKEAIDNSEALQKVTTFVDKVKKELDDKGEYIIEKLGSFTKDQNGILRFTQDPHLTEALPETEIEEPEKIEKVIDSDLLDIDSNVSSEEELKEEQKEIPVPQSTENKDTSLLNLDEKSTDEKSGAEATAKKVPPVTSGKPSAKVSTPKAPVNYGHKRFVLPPWAIALIIVIPIILVLGYLLLRKGRNNAKLPTTKKSEIVDTIRRPVIDSVAIKKAAAEEEERLRKEQAEKEVKEREAPGQVRKHNIIVGSFKNEANAHKLVNELKSKGYDQAYSFTHNNRYMVSASSYKSLQEARKAQEKILQEQQLESWILTKK